LGRFVYEIDHLVHAYGTEPVLCIEKFEVRPASIVGLAGPNGSGKTTLLKLLGFIEKPSRGVIRFQGKPAFPFSPHVRFQTALLPQEPYLLKRSVFQNIAYGLKIRKDIGEMEKRVDEALEIVGLPSREFARRRWFELSGGETQRVALAARMVLKPKVLLLDEPTANVDAESMIRIREAALQSRRSWGATLIIASHDRQWLSAVCDEIIYMFNGRIFTRALENTVFGPWTQVSKDRWGKQLSDGQILMVSSPPEPSGVAVFDPALLMIREMETARSQTSGVLLYGEIERLSLERDGGISVTVIIGNLSLTTTMAADVFSRVSLYPGQRVSLSYDAQHICWI
jgi:tungstate transport system ATP-binding protein